MIPNALAASAGVPIGTCPGLQADHDYGVLSELNVIFYISWAIIACCPGIALALCFYSASPYGRYTATQKDCVTQRNKGPEASILKKKAMASSATVPAKVAWVLQESPAFLVPAVAFFGFGLNQEASPNVVLCGAMMVHYFQRSFIYPLLIRGGKPFPVSTFVMAMQYCAINGYLQGRYLAICEPYPSEWFEDARFIIGAILFLFGMGVNLHSDQVLRNLRQPGETGYKIPQGGMFRFISAANLWGEVVEWTGFGLASWSWPGLSFTLLTAANLLPRCYQHRIHPPTSLPILLIRPPSPARTPYCKLRCTHSLVVNLCPCPPACSLIFIFFGVS